MTDQFTEKPTRRKGHSKLVYDKATRTIIKVYTPTEEQLREAEKVIREEFRVEENPAAFYEVNCCLAASIKLIRKQAALTEAEKEIARKRVVELEAKLQPTRFHDVNEFYKDEEHPMTKNEILDEAFRALPSATSEREGERILLAINKLYDSAIQTERERCAKIVEGWHIKKGGYLNLAAAIRKEEK